MFRYTSAAAAMTIFLPAKTNFPDVHASEQLTKQTVLGYVPPVHRTMMIRLSDLPIHTAFQPPSATYHLPI
jgi:hypothetical protein